MAKRNGHKPKFSLPVSVILGFMPLTAGVINNVRSAGWNDGLRNSVPYIIPYNPATRTITFAGLGMGLYPILAGFLVHKVIGGMFGVNRAMSRMGLPWVRI